MIRYWLLVPLLCGLACQNQGEEDDSDSELDPICFELLDAAETGLAYESFIRESVTNNYFLFNYLYAGGGVAIADFDGNGLEDVYFISPASANALFYNEGSFTFRQNTTAATLALEGLTKTGVTIVDINQDGRPDIYQCVTAEPGRDAANRLLVNQGDGNFIEAAAEYGLALENQSTSAAFFDMDKDGDLDVYITSRPVDYRQHTQVRIRQVGDKRVRIVEPEYPIESDILLENRDGKYVDVSSAAGISNRTFSLSVSVADFNSDGWPDMYVANDYIEPDQLYINQQDGTFVDEADSRLHHMAHSTMGADFGDLDRDGRPEIMTLDMLPDGHYRQMTNGTAMMQQRYHTLIDYGYGKQIARNMLQTSNLDGSYSEVACLADVYKTDWSWGPLFFDADNDGWDDIYITNGFSKDVSNSDFNSYTFDSLKRAGFSNQDLLAILEMMPSQKLPNYLYHNHGKFDFEEVAQQVGLGQSTMSNGAAYVDLNNDGRIDLVTHNIHDPAFIYKNCSPLQSFLKIELRGTAPNRDAVGARVRISTADGFQEKTLQPTRGFYSSQSKRLHFGLNDASTINTVEVWWPNDQYSRTTNVPASQMLIMEQAAATTSPELAAQQTAPCKVQLTELDFRHQENEFSHFNQSPLLYREFDEEGPCLAVADVNGDGLDDFYLGASVGSTGVLGIQQQDGGFKAQILAFAQDQDFEDGAAVFFDANGDGAPDLFIGSAGAVALGAALKNRLYINDGRGNFKQQSSAIPDEYLHTSAALAIDLDADGDLDLLVANHSNPLNFPEQEPNSIYINDNGSFTVMPQPAAAWRDAGMINALLLADLRGDNAQQIIAAGEWTEILVFEVASGGNVALVPDLFASAGKGLWMSLAAGDIDNDGDEDIIAGNWGLNSRFTASADKPLTLSAKDLDNNGKREAIVFGYKGGDVSLPYVRREDLAKQAPMFAKRFPRFAAYAKTDRAGILGATEASSLFEVSNLQSVALINEGSSYRAVALPRSSQVSPVNAIALVDREAGTGPELFVAGNLYETEIHGGPLDASQGQVLRWATSDHFQLDAQWAGWAKGNVRAAAQVRTPTGSAMLVARNEGPLTLVRL